MSVVPTFDSMGLKEDLMRGIYSYGFEKPSAIQQRAIMPIIKGRDVIAQSQSGAQLYHLPLLAPLPRIIVLQLITYSITAPN